MLDSLDISLLREINVNRITGLDGVFIFLSGIGPIIAASIPLVFILIGFLKKKREIWFNGIKIAAPYLLSVIISNVIKTNVARPRPFTTFSFIQKLSSGGSGSFPSGHTSDVFSIAMAVSLLYPKPGVVIPIFLWAILVAYSRMDLGVHYPTDVLAGALIGIAAALLCYVLFRYFSRKKETKDMPLVVDTK